jgi:4-amino-4-deoxy-L-arabinose transferase-like glycosyltransferase
LRSAFFLLLLTVLVNLGPWLRPDWAGTEGQRVLVAHGMLASGEWFVPSMGGEPILTKPPLYYWVLAAVESVCGISPFAARAPSVLGIWLAAVVAFGVLSRSVDRRAAWWGAIGMVSAPALVWHGAFAEIDPLFACLVAISVLWLVDGTVRASRRTLALAGLVGALAVLTKGPPFAMFMVGPLVVVMRRRARLVATWFLPCLIVPLAGFGVVFLRALDASGAASAAASTAASESVGRILAFDSASLADVPLHLLRSLAYALPFVGFLLPRLRTAAIDVGSGHARLLEIACWSAYLGAVLALVFFPARPARYLLPGIPLLAPAVAASMATFARSGRDGHNSVVQVTARGLAIVMLLALPWLPAFASVPSILAWAVLGCASWFLRGREGTLVVILATPVVLIGTVITDGIRSRSAGLRDESAIAMMLRDSLTRLGAREFEFLGNPGETLALLMDPNARWRDRVSREIRTDFVIERVRDGTGSELDPARWIERERVRGRDRVFVVAQRR